jgi:hypothetical protein
MTAAHAAFARVTGDREFRRRFCFLVSLMGVRAVLGMARKSGDLRPLAQGSTGLVRRMLKKNFEHRSVGSFLSLATAMPNYPR